MFEFVALGFGFSFFVSGLLVYYAKYNKTPQRSEKDLFVQELIDGVKDGTLKVEKRKRLVELERKTEPYKKQIMEME